MPKFRFIIIIFVLIISLCSSIAVVWAQPVEGFSFENSAYDLINAVNALRVAYGLPAYSISSILMYTAQTQSDYMAANGVVTHLGPGGSTPSQRILAAGYPLAGDLSLGGFRSENIIALGKDGSAQDAVIAWMGDTPHQTTMLSPDLTEIGAGMTITNGRVYYVIDCALPTTDIEVLASTGTSVVDVGSSVPESGDVMIAVSVNTPNPSGQVVHVVQSGQALWSIAIAYGVKIDEIKNLNNLSGNDIYPGEKLLIKNEITQTPIPSMAVMTNMVTSPPTPTVTSTPDDTPEKFTNFQPLKTPEKKDNRSVMIMAFIIVLVAIVVAAVFAGGGGSNRNT